MGKEVLALVCPDWRGAALVLEGPTWRVAYANWGCLELVTAADGPALIAEERLLFNDAAFNDRFYACLEHSARFHIETVVLIGQAGTRNTAFSVALRNPQGLFREVLARGLGRRAAARDYIAVEFAVPGHGLEPAAHDAFAAAFNLTPAEMEVVELIAMGLGAETAAKRRGTALSTIRQRVKTVLAKTGCRRQLELARLVNALLPARASNAVL